MQLKYDLSVGALYIRLTDHTVARTREIDDNTNVDLDAAGRPVGIEVLSIYHPWPLETVVSEFGISGPERAQLVAYFRPQSVAQSRASQDAAPDQVPPPQFSVEPLAAVAAA